MCERHAQPGGSNDQPRRSGLLLGLILLALLLSAAQPLAAQNGEDMPPVFQQALRLLITWGIVALVLFLGGLFAAGRLLGLDISPMDAVAAFLFGIVIAIVPLAVLSAGFRDALGDQLGPLVVQAVSLGALWLAVKLTFKTDGVRATACLLLASIFSLGVTSVLLVALY